MNSTETKIKKDAPQGGAIVEPDADAIKAFATEAEAARKSREKRQAEIEREMKALQKASEAAPDPTATTAAAPEAAPKTAPKPQ